MLIIDHIVTKGREITIVGMMDRVTCIDRFEITMPTYTIVHGWVDISVCDRLAYRGPYRWFLDGSIELIVTASFPLRIHCVVHDNIDFSITPIYLAVYEPDGKCVSVKYPTPVDKE